MEIEKCHSSMTKDYSPNLKKNVKAFNSFAIFSEEIEKDSDLKDAMKVLPSNYNFEIHKTIWRIKKANAKHVALQFPEGLMMFATIIADILELWTSAEITIMGDVTYGACCVDDYTASECGADFMVHYGHSCLVPIDRTKSVPCLYIFVDIHFDADHLMKSIEIAFSVSIPIALVSIIQFVSSLQRVAQDLRAKGYTVAVPQCHPLSPGEVLGCTSIAVPDGHIIIALGDGRFHLESIMISNPNVETYLYNPYSKVLSREYYDQSKMLSTRGKEITKASSAQNWGIILGSLGRQGSLKVLQNLEEQMAMRKKDYTVFVMSEIFPDTLKPIAIDAWIQIACPRLSIDWGTSFNVPLLNPYEGSVALRNAEWHEKTYPMDFYAQDSKGAWTPNHLPPCSDNCKVIGKCSRGLRCKEKKS